MSVTTDADANTRMLEVFTKVQAAAQQNPSADPQNLNAVDIGIMTRDQYDSARVDGSEAAFYDLQDAFNAARNLAKAAWDLANADVDTVRNRIISYDTRLTQLLRQHSSTLRERRHEADRLSVLLNNREDADYSNMLLPFEKVESIKELQFVKDASVTSRGEVKIELYPLVMYGDSVKMVCDECENDGWEELNPDCSYCTDDAYTAYLSGLSFTVSPINYSVKVERNGSGHYPHPHVSGNGDACWGHAGTAINDCIDRQDFDSLTHIIIAWASVYNDESPYRTLNQYPMADRGMPHGWQVPSDSDTQESSE